MKFDLDQTVDVLQRTPATLRALLDGMTDPFANGNEGPETFSPFDVVGHLIDGEETDWIPRARIILSTAADKSFTPYDRFRHRERNVGRTLDSMLSEFSRLRAENVEQLRIWQLSDPQLDQTGVHPTFGPVTLRQLLAAWVVHDLGHIAQVSRVMAKQYRDEVGPWVPFMPVLTDHEVRRS